MPYITRDRKNKFEMQLEDIGFKLHLKGELTYCIYKLGIEYLRHHKKDYQNISDICAAMHDAEQEFRRRILNNYEDSKIKENGDIE